MVSLEATPQEQFISSPNWPFSYNIDEVCEWWISTEEGQFVEINFRTFDIESSYDFLVSRPLCRTIRKDMCICTS